MSLVTAFGAALTSAPVLGIVRRDSAAAAVLAVDALASGGLGAIEISLTTGDALEAFAQARSATDRAVSLGLGTVRTELDAERGIEAGAEFLVSPNFSARVVEIAHAAGLPIVCGVLTPTEIQVAVDAGVEWLKLFPAGTFGPGYLRDLVAPFPELRFVPTGGVRLDQVGEYRRAGASAVGLAGALLGSESSDAGAMSSAAQAALANWADADVR